MVEKIEKAGDLCGVFKTNAIDVTSQSETVDLNLEIK